MKSIIFIILIFAVTDNCSGQNLVNNPGFENISSCPDFLSQIDKAIGWSSWSITSDLFHVCSATTTPTPDAAGVPANWLGYQYPRSGSAYGGFVAFSSYVGNIRESLGTQLNQPLIIGQKYFVKFFVTRAHAIDVNNPNPIAGCNKLGALFSTVPFYGLTLNPPPINNFAHIYSDSLISDTTNWVLISGSFIADSAYTYVGFGNFFNASATTYVLYGIHTPTVAYYYIDDVSVSTDSLFTTGITVEPEEGSILFPNPFNENLNITVSSQSVSEIVLYDIIGKIILKNQFFHSITLNTEHIVKGIYLYEIRNKKGAIRKGKVLKE